MSLYQLSFLVIWLISISALQFLMLVVSFSISYSCIFHIVWGGMREFKAFIGLFIYMFNEL